MVVFELTMPGIGSWNGKWSGSGKKYYRARKDREVPSQYWHKDFHYRWNDGWAACVSVYRMPAADARKMLKESAGFRGYDWMIDSIIKYGKIMTDSEIREMEESRANAEPFGQHEHI